MHSASPHPPKAGGWTLRGCSHCDSNRSTPPPIPQDLVQTLSLQGLSPSSPHRHPGLQPKTTPQSQHTGLPSNPPPAHPLPSPTPQQGPNFTSLQAGPGASSGLPTRTAPSHHGSIRPCRVSLLERGYLSIRLSVPAARALLPHRVQRKALNTHAKSLNELEKIGKTQKSWKRKQTTRESSCYHLGAFPSSLFSVPVVSVCRTSP